MVNLVCSRTAHFEGQEQESAAWSRALPQVLFHCVPTQQRSWLELEYVKSLEIIWNQHFFVTPLWTSYKFSLELISCCFWCCRCAEVLRFGKGFFRQRTYELVDEKQCFWLNQILHAVTEKRSVSSGPKFMGGHRVVSQPMPWHPTIMCWKEIWWSWWMLLQRFLPNIPNVCSNPKNNYRQVIISYPNFIQFQDIPRRSQQSPMDPMGCSLGLPHWMESKPLRSPCAVAHAMCRAACYRPEMCDNYIDPDGYIGLEPRLDLL